MDAKIAHRRLLQQRGDRIGHAANANLQAGTIFDLLGDQGCHRAVNLRRFGIGQFRRWHIIALNHVIHLAAMHAHMRANHARHIGQGFDDESLGGFDDGGVPDIDRTKIEIALCIHRRRAQHGDVRARDEAAIVVRDFAKMTGQVIDQPLVMLAPVIARKMPVVAGEMCPFRVLFQKGARLHAEAIANTYIAERVFACGKGTIKNIRLVEAGAEIEPIAWLHQRCGFLGRDHMRIFCHGECPQNTIQAPGEW